MDIKKISRAIETNIETNKESLILGGLTFAGLLSTPIAPKISQSASHWLWLKQENKLAQRYPNQIDVPSYTALRYRGSIKPHILERVIYAYHSEALKIPALAEMLKKLKDRKIKGTRAETVVKRHIIYFGKATAKIALTHSTIGFCLGLLIINASRIVDSFSKLYEHVAQYAGRAT